MNHRVLQCGRDATYGVEIEVASEIYDALWDLAIARGQSIDEVADSLIRAAARALRATSPRREN